jgi:hypothetical protein
MCVRRKSSRRRRLCLSIVSLVRFVEHFFILFFIFIILLFYLFQDNLGSILFTYQIERPRSDYF